MKVFKKPDLNAPRFRPKRLNILNNDFCNQLKKKHPQLKKYSNRQIKDIVSCFNGMFRQQVIEHREGVEFMEQLGNVFIGTCPRKKSDNPNFAMSSSYGLKIQHRNWESDQYLAKIFYTNFESRYTFRFHELWGFEPLRDFKRSVAHTYPENWKRYIMVDNMVRVSRIFRKERYKDKMRQQLHTDLSTYDEFQMD